MSNQQPLIQAAPVQAPVSHTGRNILVAVLLLILIAGIVLLVGWGFFDWFAPPPAPVSAPVPAPTPRTPSASQPQTVVTPTPTGHQVTPRIGTNLGGSSSSSTS